MIGRKPAPGVAEESSVAAGRENSEAIVTGAVDPVGAKHGPDDLALGPVAPTGTSSKRAKDPYSVARAIVLRRLTRAPRSREELRKSLRDREIPADVQDQVLDRFTDLGLIDDSALARSFVEYKTENGRGRRAIAYKLRARGISDELIQSALSGVTDEDELLQAEGLVERRWARFSHLERAVRIRRLTGMLSRRGYSAPIVSGAIRKVEEHRRDEEEGEETARIVGLGE